MKNVLRVAVDKVRSTFVLTLTVPVASEDKKGRVFRILCNFGESFGGRIAGNLEQFFSRIKPKASLEFFS